MISPKRLATNTNPKETRIMAKAPRTPTVKATWKRIELFLAEHGPTQAKSLAPGATDAQIEKLESHIGIALPKQLRDSLAIHDGQKEECDFIPDGYGSFYFLRLCEIRREWDSWNSLMKYDEFDDSNAQTDAGVAQSWWNRGWIPFASNGASDSLCVDLAPARGGKKGQVIMMRHDDPRRPILAPTFAAWLHQLAESLKAGEMDEYLE